MLKYKFVSADEYHSTDDYTGYDAKYPHSLSNQDKTEFLICGEGEMSEQEMNAYKLANWPQPEEEFI